MTDEYPNNNFGTFFDKHPNFANAVDIYSGKQAIKKLKQDKLSTDKFLAVQKRHQTQPTSLLKAAKGFAHDDIEKIHNIDPKKAYTSEQFSTVQNNNVKHLSGIALEANVDAFMKYNRKHFTDENQIYQFQKDIHRNDLTTIESINDTNSHISHINHQLNQQHMPQAFQTNDNNVLRKYVNSPSISDETARQLASKIAYGKVNNNASYINAHGTVDRVAHYSTRGDIKSNIQHNVHYQMKNRVHYLNSKGQSPQIITTTTNNSIKAPTNQHVLDQYPDNNFGTFFDKHPNFANAVDIYSGKQAIKKLKQNKLSTDKFLSAQKKHQTQPTSLLKAAKGFAHDDVEKIHNIDPKKAYTSEQFSTLQNNNVKHLSGIALESNIDAFMRTNRKHFADENQIYQFQKDIHRDDMTTSEAITNDNSHMLHINHQLKRQHKPQAFQTNNVNDLRQYINSPRITDRTAYQLANKMAYSKERNNATHVDAHGTVDRVTHYSTRKDINYKIHHNVHRQMQNRDQNLSGMKHQISDYYNMQQNLQGIKNVLGNGGNSITMNNGLKKPVTQHTLANGQARLQELHGRVQSYKGMAGLKSTFKQAQRQKPINPLGRASKISLGPGAIKHVSNEQEQNRKSDTDYNRNNKQVAQRRRKRNIAQHATRPRRHVTVHRDRGMNLE